METKKMTIYINPEIHKEIKILAAETNSSISEIAEYALKDFLEKHRRKEINPESEG